ncbi:MAG: ribosome silencing factor, partial [Rhodoferax sp.]|nr:ribosome silencing factor [Rhodoferax sp.]
PQTESVAKKDTQKLQRAIVDGLEDVKAQDIAVFDTEHLSALFERVIVASGTSNRQTKALAASVRDAVREAGFPKPRIEGEENGEWIIVDCGQAVVHVMQPAIRQYYHLEELWGEKPVRLKFGAAKPLPKAEEAPAPAKPKAAAKKAPAKKLSPFAAKKAAKEKAKALAESLLAPERPVMDAPKRAPKKSAEAPAPVKRAAAKAPAKTVARTVAKTTAKTTAKAPAKKTPLKTIVVKPPVAVQKQQAAAKKATAKSTAAKKTPARKA